jgi:hypothetical protein
MALARDLVGGKSRMLKRIYSCDTLKAILSNYIRCATGLEIETKKAYTEYIPY